MARPHKSAKQATDVVERLAPEEAKNVLHLVCEKYPELPIGD